ncbi:MAG: 6,7-dimethyl-8-ribityllumazine synthase [Bacteroidetes bacterium]|nr:MAG: 6,7-dimethyl-8-ribityllumazine synthase [Bacteroidota bacterium]
MSSTLKNLSSYSTRNLPTATALRFGIVVAEWNEEITSALLDGALETLKKHGAQEQNIVIKTVPGSFELSLGAQWLAQDAKIDAVIALGCIIQGETRHFDFIAQAVAIGINEVGLKHNKPVIFGVLTTDNLEQAQDRSGGKHGNKGDEAAITALKMLGF